MKSRVVFVILTLISVVNLYADREYMLERFKNFQRILLPFDEGVSLEIDEKEEDKFIDLIISPVPSGITKTAENVVINGSVIKGHRVFFKEGSAVIRLKVVSPEVSVLQGRDPETGYLAVNLGVSEKISHSTDKDSVDHFIVPPDFKKRLEDEKQKHIIAQVNLMNSFLFDSLPVGRSFVDYKPNYSKLKGKDREIDIFNRAVDFYEKSEYDAAAEEISDLTEKFPESPLHVAVDFLKIDIDRLKAFSNPDLIDNSYVLDIIHRYRSTVATKPTSDKAPWSYYIMGELGFMLNMYGEAMRDFSVILNRFPNSEVSEIAKLRMAEFYLMKNKLSTVSNYLEKIETDEKEKTLDYEILGLITDQISEKRGKIVEVPAYVLNKSDRELSEVSRLLFPIGEILLAGGQLREAERIFNILEKNPRTDVKVKSLASLRKSDINFLKNSAQEALMLYRKTAEKYSGTPGGRLAELQVKELRYLVMDEETDKKIYYNALKNSRDEFENAVVLYKLAIHHKNSEDYVSALSLTGILLERYCNGVVFSESVKFFNNLLYDGFEKLYKNGNFEDIVNIANMVPECISKHPRKSRMFMIAGKSFSRMGMFSAASIMYNNILESDISRDDFYRSVAVLNLLDIYIKEEMKERARLTLEYYKDSVRKSKDVYPLFLRLSGDYYHKLEKNSEKALDLYKKALAREPYSINRYIISLKIGKIYFESEKYSEVLRYTTPLYRQFETMHTNYSFLVKGVEYYLLSLLLTDRFGEFADRYEKVRHKMPALSESFFNLISAVYYIEKGDLKIGREMLEKADHSETVEIKNSLQKVLDFREKKSKKIIELKKEMKRVEKIMKTIGREG